MSIIIYAVGFTAFLAFANFKLIQASIFILLVLDSAILLYAALRIRKIVSNFGIVNPNQKLVNLHLITFCVMTISFIVVLIYDYLCVVAVERLDELEKTSPEYK